MTKTLSRIPLMLATVIAVGVSGSFSVEGPGFSPLPPEPKLPFDRSSVGTGHPALLVRTEAAGTGVVLHFQVWCGKTLMGETAASSPSWRYDGVPLRVGEAYQWRCRVLVDGDTSDWFSPKWSFTISALGVEESPWPAPASAAHATPSLFREQVGIVVPMEFGPAVSVEVISVQGQFVRTLATGSRPARDRLFVWDGRDRAGEPVVPGSYFCRVTGGQRQEVLRVTKLD